MKKGEGTCTVSQPHMGEGNVWARVSQAGTRVGYTQREYCSARWLCARTVLTPEKMSLLHLVLLPHPQTSQSTKLRIRIQGDLGTAAHEYMR